MYQGEEKVTISVCSEVCVGGGGGGESCPGLLGGGLRGAAQHPEEFMARVLLAPSSSVALGDSLAQGMVSW